MLICTSLALYGRGEAFASIAKKQVRGCYETPESTIVVDREVLTAVRFSPRTKRTDISTVGYNNPSILSLIT